MKKILLLLCMTLPLFIQAQRYHKLPTRSPVNTTDLVIVVDPNTGKQYKAEKGNVVQDTASLSARINLKLNQSDTASLSARINTKQATLVSATSIKTLNSTSLLGAGDIELPITLPTATLDTLSSPVPGRLYYDNTVNKLRYYNGTAWKYIAVEE